MIVFLMILTVRRILPAFLFVPALACSLTSWLAWTAWRGGLLTWQAGAYTAGWWSLRPSVPSDLIWALSGLTFLSAFALSCELVYRRRFGRNPFPEVFFLRVFFLTLPLQAVRLILPAAAAFDLSPVWGLTATRIAWFFRFFGLSALMCTGIFSGEIAFRRSGSVLGTGVLAATGVAVMMPLDVTQPLGNFLIRSGIDTSLALICISVSVLSALALAGNMLRNSRYGIMAVFLLLIAGGSDVVFFLSRPLLIPGALAMATGAAGFSYTTRRIYQWI